MLADIEHLHDVGMYESSNRTCFAEKPGAPVELQGRWSNRLDRYLTSEKSIRGDEHRSHRTLTKDTGDLVTTK